MNVYDFDKTIYKKDSSVEFYKFCIKKKPIILFLCLPTQIKNIFLYKIKRKSKEEMKEKYFIFLKYINGQRYVEEFVDLEINNIMNWYLELKQDDDVVISASPEFLVLEFMKRLNIGNVIATKVSIETGRFQSKNCYGLEKRVMYEKKYGDRSIDNFYSDSKSDKYLANISKSAFLVKKGRIQRWRKQDLE